MPEISTQLPPPTPPIPAATHHYHHLHHHRRPPPPSFSSPRDQQQVAYNNTSATSTTTSTRPETHLLSDPNSRSSSSSRLHARVVSRLTRLALCPTTTTNTAAVIVLPQPAVPVPTAATSSNQPQQPAAAAAVSTRHTPNFSGVASPMCRSPPEQAVGAVLSNTAAALPHVTVSAVRPVRNTARLQRIYEVDVSSSSSSSAADEDREEDHDDDDAERVRRRRKRTLMLVVPPPNRLRLLRAEQFMVVSEAVVVQWIRGCLENGGGGRGGCLGRTGGQLQLQQQQQQRRRRSTDDKDEERKEEEEEEEEEEDLKTVLLPFLPTLIHSSGPSSVNELGSNFSFFEPPTRDSTSSTPTPIDYLPTPLTPSQRRAIDTQLGALHRRLAQLTSPSGMFGPAAAVLGLSVPYRQPPPLPQGVNGSSGSGSGNLNNGADGNGGTASWSMAFHSMLESILRDGEDMAVMVAYGTIRRHFRRLRHLLDEVTVPRVVVVDAAEGGNVLVDFDPESGEEGLVRISGLRDWSYCVFGDPLLASVFSDEPPPSEEFLAGFNNGNGGKWSSGEEETETETETETSAAGMALNRDLIEDTETAGTRLLLYQMYHATVSIVKEFYRPRTQSSRRELEARKRLTEALARLEQVHEDPKRRHQRPNGEMSPAKRARQDDGGGGG